MSGSGTVNFRRQDRQARLPLHWTRESVCCGAVDDDNCPMILVSRGTHRHQAASERPRRESVVRRIFTQFIRGEWLQTTLAIA